MSHQQRRSLAIPRSGAVSETKGGSGRQGFSGVSEEWGEARTKGLSCIIDSELTGNHWQQGVAPTVGLAAGLPCAVLA